MCIFSVRSDVQRRRQTEDSVFEQATEECDSRMGFDDSWKKHV